MRVACVAAPRLGQVDDDDDDDDDDLIPPSNPGKYFDFDKNDSKPLNYLVLLDVYIRIITLVTLSHQTSSAQHQSLQGNPTLHHRQLTKHVNWTMTGRPSTPDTQHSGT